MNSKVRFNNIALKKIRRTIFRSPFQFLAVVLITMLATTLFSGLYASYQGFNNQINELYETSNFANIWTSVVASDDASKDKEYIVNAVGDKGVVESRYNASCKLNGHSSIIALSDYYPTINKHYSTDNTVFEDKDFFVMEKRFRHGLRYGGEDVWYDKETKTYKDVKVSIPIASMLSDVYDTSKGETNPFNGIVKPGVENIFVNNYINITIKPSGEMIQPESVDRSENADPIFFLSRNYARRVIKESLNACFDISKLVPTPGTPAERAYNILNNPDEYFINKYYKDNQYVTKLHDSSNTAIVMASINNSLSKSDAKIITNFDRDNLPTNKILISDLKQSQMMAIAFPVLFFIVSILVVITTLSQITLKERNDIGTLKALGVSTKQVIIYYITLAAIICLTGVILGLVVGPLLLPPVMQIKYINLYRLPGVRYVFPWQIALIITLSVLIIVSLVTYLIARKEAKCMPSISMRPKAHNIYKGKSTITSNKKNINKISMKMAFRNIRCSKARSLMVVIGVLGSVGLLCGGFGIDDSLKYGLNNDVDKFLNCDVMVGFSGATDKTRTQLEDMYHAKKISAFEQYCYLPSSVYKLGVSDNAFSSYAYGINTETYKYTKFFNFGDYKVQANDIIVTNKVADALHLQIGNPIKFQILGKDYVGKVSAIINTFYIHGIFYDGRSASYPSIDGYGNFAYARINHDLKIDDEIYKEIESIEGVASFMTYNGIIDNFNEIFASMSTITLAIKVFAILLALVVLYNFAVLNYKERNRDIATMKVLGFNRKEISLSLIIEIMVLTTVGIAIGLAVGLPFEMLILTVNKTSVLEYMYSMSVVSLVISFAIAFAASLILNIFLGFRSKQVKMVESLKSIE